MQNGKNRLILLIIGIIAARLRAVGGRRIALSPRQDTLFPLDARRAFQLDQNDVNAYFRNAFEVDIHILFPPAEPPSARSDDALDSTFGIGKDDVRDFTELLPVANIDDLLLSEFLKARIHAISVCCLSSNLDKFLYDFFADAPDRVLFEAGDLRLRDTHLF